MKFYFLLMLILIVGGCGKDRGNGGSAELEENGVYRVVLTTVNPHIPGNNAYGTAEIIPQENEEVKIRVDVIDAHGHITHHQEIASGSCPTLPGSDHNGDGVVDAREANTTTHIELKSNGNSPISSSLGNYSFTDTISKSELENLQGKVLLVRGVRTANVPPTASSISDLSASEALPVACGPIVFVPHEG